MGKSAALTASYKKYLWLWKNLKISYKSVEVKLILKTSIRIYQPMPKVCFCCKTFLMFVLKKMLFHENPWPIFALDDRLSICRCLFSSRIWCMRIIYVLFYTFKDGTQVAQALKMIGWPGIFLCSKRTQEILQTISSDFCLRFSLSSAKLLKAGFPDNSLCCEADRKSGHSSLLPLDSKYSWSSLKEERL